MNRIILAGGSGFVGQFLGPWLRNAGHEVVVLTRSPKTDTAPIRQVEWDGKTIGPWARELDSAQAVINLAGRSVNCRYHVRNRRLMMDSRLDSTRILGEAIARCQNSPRVWLNASTATIYKHTFGPAWNEDGEIGSTAEAKDEFSIEIATAWEREFAKANTPATRKVALRSAMVLGHGSNSVFPVMRRLVRLGLGGKLASGRQFVSWIHEADFCRAIDWLLAQEEFNGVVNLAAPNPVTNADMMRTLRELCGMRVGLPARLWMLEVGAFVLRTETELLIKSRRVVPGRLLVGGFEFRFPEIRGAFEDLCGRT
jgi:uncharacterized protein (TIGR01777 family)